MKSYILTCSCHNMGKRASEAFCLLYPKEVLPEIVKGRDRLYKLGKQLSSPHLLALSKLSGKFAYYVEIEDNKIIKEVNLLNGRRTG